MHVLIVGQTMSGKTSIAKRLAAEYRAKGTPVIVCDPFLDQWDCDALFDNIDDFMQCVRGNQSCALFIDESGQSIGQWNTQTFWLATTARHFGHKSHFITQRAAQLNPTVRTQCAALFCFNCSYDDAKVLANEFNKPQLRDANKLKQFEYIYCSRFGDIIKSQVKILDTPETKGQNDAEYRNRINRGGRTPADTGQSENGDIQ